MNFIKQLLLVLLVSGACFGQSYPSDGVLLPDTILPNGSFPSHVSDYGYGGWHVSTNPSSIPAYLRYGGTASWNPTNDTLYVYSEGSGSWEEIFSVSTLTALEDNDDSIFESLNSITETQSVIYTWGDHDGLYAPISIVDDTESLQSSVSNLESEVTALTSDIDQRVNLTSATNTFMSGTNEVFRFITLTNGLLIQINTSTGWVSQIEIVEE